MSLACDCLICRAVSGEFDSSLQQRACSPATIETAPTDSAGKTNECLLCGAAIIYSTVRLCDDCWRYGARGAKPENAALSDKTMPTRTPNTK
jgi:hypothetical protein